MEERRYFWVFDRTIFDQIELPEFTLMEGVLFIIALFAFASYWLLIVYLDGRSRAKAKESKQLAWLERWQESAGLSPAERISLELLAEDETRIGQYRLLSDPVRFETRVHEEVAAARPIGRDFVDKVRDKLGYTSHNLRVPVASTRQLQPGDAVRLTLWRGGLPHHFYGKVAEGGLRKFEVRVRAEAVKIIGSENASVDLFYIRALGLEYMFSAMAAEVGSQPDRLRMAHALVRKGYLPRRARLPLMIEVSYRMRSFGKDAVSDLDPDAAPSETGRGLLLDLSSGGFAMGHEEEVPEGHYIEFSVPLKKKRRPLSLIGRVLECRPFSGNQWLSRCALRGLSTEQRSLLIQVVRMEQQNRLRALAPIRRRAAKAS